MAYFQGFFSQKVPKKSPKMSKQTFWEHFGEILGTSWEDFGQAGKEFHEERKL